MARERRRDVDEQRSEERAHGRADPEAQERTDVDWERGSGGIDPRGDAVPRPRAPRVYGVDAERGGARPR